MIGFTELQATLNEACIGEEVTLTCATSSSFLGWRVSQNIEFALPLSRLFQDTDTVGESYSVSTNELQLLFELTFNSMGTLNSTLLVHTTAAIENALIRCEGAETRSYMFKLARMLLALHINLHACLSMHDYCSVTLKLLGGPIMPGNIIVSRKIYNEIDVNFTLSWNSPLSGRVDAYNISITYEPIQLINYLTTALSIEVQGIPYDEVVIISIASVNCHSESEKAYFNFTISEMVKLLCYVRYSLVLIFCIHTVITQTDAL